MDVLTLLDHKKILLMMANPPIEISTYDYFLYLKIAPQPTDDIAINEKRDLYEYYKNISDRLWLYIKDN